MTKRTLIVALAVALALIGTGCDSLSQSKPQAPAVATDVVNDGATLRLSWQAVEKATSYEITAGSSVDTTEATSFDVTTPAATVEVRSLNGASKSDSAARIDCKIVESTIEFFGDLAPIHENGFSFGGNGSAVGCTLKYPDQLSIDFYGQLSGADMMLVAGGTVNRNRRGNQLKAAPGSYDGATMADLPGTYATSLVIMADSTYYLRVSADTTSTWSTGDHYAKANVVAIGDSAKLTIKLGYQREEGLRWLIK